MDLDFFSPPCSSGYLQGCLLLLSIRKGHMGQDDHLGVGQEGRSCWWWGCSSFYWGAGLCFTRVLGWAPSCISGAVSPATAAGHTMPWRGPWVLQGNVDQGSGHLPGRVTGNGTGCSLQCMDLEAPPPFTQVRAGCGSRQLLTRPLPKSLFITGKRLDHFCEPVP